VKGYQGSGHGNEYKFGYTDQLSNPDFDEWCKFLELRYGHDDFVFLQDFTKPGYVEDPRFQHIFTTDGMC